MTMIPTPTGYDLMPAPRLSPRPAHRAVMTAEGARLNLMAKACGLDYGLHGAHWAPLTKAAAWLAEEAAQEREIIRAVSR